MSLQVVPRIADFTAIVTGTFLVTIRALLVPRDILFSPKLFIASWVGTRLNDLEARRR
jgi:hypothetical protein